MVDIGFDGFSVAYEREELQFPICVLAGLSTAFLFEAIALPSFALLIAAFVLAAAVYYNIPLVETGTLRLSVNSRGFGVYALGLLPWSNIAAIELITNSLRG